MPFSYTVKKGDTLNSIASRYGFKDYKSAGVSSVPSGNFDLIREGETITLGNYDPNNIKTFGSTSPVISSLDDKAEFLQNTDKITAIEQKTANPYTGILPAGATPIYADGKTVNNSNPIGYSTADGKTTMFSQEKGAKEEDTTDTEETTGDPIYDNILRENKKKEKALEAEKAQKLSDYNASYQTSLASLDSTVASTIANLNATYAKRIQEQERINKLNIDRTKAYGLANGGQYTPLDFGDAVSLREQEASDKILSLENERNALIQQAKSARDTGASALLRQNLQDLDKIENDIRKELREVQTESEKRYKILRDIRIDEEKKQKERREKMITQISNLSGMYADDFEGMTPEEQDTFIKQLVEKTGLDYATIYGTLTAGILKGKKDALGLEKEEIAVKTAWRKAQGEGDTKVTPEKMSADAPEEFASDEDFKKQMTAFVRKYGTAGASYWDKVYQKDSVGDYTYTVKAVKAPAKNAKTSEPDVIVKKINGVNTTLKKGADGKYYPI